MEPCRARARACLQPDHGKHHRIDDRHAEQPAHRRALDDGGVVAAAACPPAEHEATAEEDTQRRVVAQVPVDAVALHRRRSDRVVRRDKRERERCGRRHAAAQKQPAPRGAGGGAAGSE